MVVKFDTRNAAGYRTALDKLRQFSVLQGRTFGDGGSVQ
jgi:hypothetical protein